MHRVTEQDPREPRAEICGREEIQVLSQVEEISRVNVIVYRWHKRIAEHPGIVEEDEQQGVRCDRDDADSCREPWPHLTDALSVGLPYPSSRRAWPVGGGSGSLAVRSPVQEEADGEPQLIGVTDGRA